MVTKLELAVDSSGVKAGLVDANRALDETAKKADRAEKEVRDLGDKSAKAGKNMSAAFAATGGGLAVTHGLSGIADGFRRADGSMAAFAASQALLDMGRMAEDMKGVAGATGQATSMFSKMGAIMKAHPIMTIAALLAAAATAMSMFGGETEEAADDMERLADAMEKVRVGRDASQLLGISQLSPAQQEQSNVRSLAESFIASQQTGGMTYGQMAGGLGSNYQPSSLLQLQEIAGVMKGPSPKRRKARTKGFASEYSYVDVPLSEQQVSQEAAQAILRSIYGRVSAEVTKLQAKTPPGGGGGLPPSIAGAQAPLGFPLPSAESVTRQTFGGNFPNAGQPFYMNGIQYPGSYGTGSMLMRQPGGPGTFGYQPAQQTTQEGETLNYADIEAERNQAMAEANQNMQELIMKGEQFGQTIGDAFMRVADGTMTAKQAMAELVRTFAQMGAQGVFKSIGGAVAGGFGTTQTQETYNNNPPQPT